MSKKFYIWKDKNCNGVNPEWVEVNYKQFKEIMNHNKLVDESEKRWFYRMPPITDGDDYLVLECTHSEYMKSQIEKEKRSYKIEISDLYQLLSFDFEYTDDSGENYTLHDIVVDNSVNVEMEALKNMEIHSLYKAISMLNDTDRDFISFWIDKKEEGASDEEISIMLNVTRDKFRWNFKQVCKNLKKILENLK